jgi:GNAT superfamily N-acetyltransferase
MYPSPTIRVATKEDAEGLWNILEPVIRKGGTYVFSLDKSKESMMGYWMGAEKTTFVVERGGELVGTFYLKSNQEGLGDHVCNAGFVVAPEAEGQGLGRWMGTIALEEAKVRGYLAMHFNFVLGEIPEAYRHPQLGLVSALIFYKKL